MRNRKKQQTLEGRLSVAAAQAQSALDVFEGLVTQLETAADAAKEVETDAENERVRLQSVAWQAGATATNYKAKASKIKELFK